MANQDTKLLEGPDVTLWQVLSEQVQVARHQGQPTALNEKLLGEAKKRRNDPLGLAFLLWSAESLMLEARFAEAIPLLSDIALNQQDAHFLEVPVVPAVLENLAVCQERLDDTDAAIKTYQALAARFPGMSAWAHYQAGRSAEEAGRLDDARVAYLAASQAQDQPSQNSWPMPELARRANARLDSKMRSQFPRLEQLATLLARTLRNRDAAALRDLASPTHFIVGIAGAHFDFVDPAEILDHLETDLLASAPVMDSTALEGSGGRRYLNTQGWSGDWFRGRVTFLLSQSAGGWEWSGIIFFHVPEPWLDRMEPADKETNQPLAIAIKAPWPAGQNFTAGGLLNFIGEQALAFIVPFYFPAVSFRPCGFGPGGFYYNFGGTHQGSDAFSIDFTRYLPGVPYANMAGFSPVLACFAGVVTLARGTIASGDLSMDNRVEIRHTNVDFSSRLPALIRTQYLSKSLHLAGPGLPVSRFMFVRQGARLGMIDNTGNSAFEHLHFSIHDDNMGGMSVRPTPMDGQSLGDADRGRCVASSNVPFP